MRRFWYFDVSVWSVDRKPYNSRLCQNSVFTPYCKNWEPIYPPNTFVHLQFPWIQLRFTQTPPKHSPDNPIASLWNITCQHTPPDANRHRQRPQETDRCCLRKSGSVSWHLLLSVGIPCSQGISGGCLGGVWGVSGGIWVVFVEIGGAWICLGGIRVLNPCSMEWKHYFGTALNGTVFCQLTILRHQNTKTAAYKLAKNDWVRPFFAIFRFIREILFVTVAFDHTVALLCRRLQETVRLMGCIIWRNWFAESIILSLPSPCDGIRWTID